jgi:uroporphyrinogen decarboxylase
VNAYAWPYPEGFLDFELMASCRSMFKPALRRIAESVKSYRADLPVVFHTDGVIKRIIPDFVEIGIDVLNPLEPLPANGEHSPHVRECAEPREVLSG